VSARGWQADQRLCAQLHGRGKQPARGMIFFTYVVLVLSQLSLLSQFVNLLIYKVFISFSETTARQHLAVLRQHSESVIFCLAGSETTLPLRETTQNHQCCLGKIQWRGL
jgi:hypothetical protein